MSASLTSLTPLLTLADLDVVMLSRLQFAFTIMFHYLFPPLTIGILTILGVTLGAFVSPWFLILPAFLGCGLTFAGATGWCGLALLLGKMPWNKVDCGASCSTR